MAVGKHINGVEYTEIGTHETKDAAREQAERLRKNGYKARVVPLTNRYVVYSHR